jgi:hypothetical protein
MRRRIVPPTPEIQHVSPTDPDYHPSAYPGDLLTITGKNFGTDTNVSRAILLRSVPTTFPLPASIIVGELAMKSASPEKLEAMIPLDYQPGDYWLTVRVGPIAYAAPVSISVRQKGTPPTGPIPIAFSIDPPFPGALATIKGSGFRPNTIVRFKDVAVDPDVTYVDSGTLRVRIPPTLKPGPTEYQVEFNFLASKWMPLQIEMPMPLNLYFEETDVNGLPLNPKWGWQLTRQYGAPDYYPNPLEIVPVGQGLLGLLAKNWNWAAATDFQVSFDDGHWCGPHVNWGPVTYVGAVKWSSHSIDDDYNYWLFPEEGAGATFRTDDNIGGHQVEHDSDETIDNFHSVWWEQFHDAVDHNEAKARQMIDGKYTIVTALIGMDCQHGCQTELHPAWLMATRVEEQGQDETWAMFARNWGNQGWCGTSQHSVLFAEDGGMARAEVRLPWREGAGSVQVVAQNFATSGDNQVEDPVVTPEPGKGVRVTWWLPPPERRGFSNGSLTLRWTPGSRIAGLSASAAALAAAATGAKVEEEPILIQQFRLALPEPARAAFDQQLPLLLAKSPARSSIPAPRATRNAPAPLKVTRVPAHDARPDVVSAERKGRLENALRGAGVTTIPFFPAKRDESGPTGGALSPGAKQVISSATPTPVREFTIEPNVNRAGGDYQGVPLQGGYEECQAACAKDARCKAFTWVKPGVQAATAVCWLKDSVPAATPNTDTVSGVVR